MLRDDNTKQGSHLRRRAGKSAAVALLCGVTFFGGLASPSFANPGSIEQVAAQVDQLSNEAAHAGERANGARLQLSAAQASLAEAEAKLAAARAELESQREALQSVARAMYVNGGMDNRILSFATDDPGDMIHKLDQLTMVSAGQARVIAGAKAAATAVAQAEAEARTQAQAAQDAANEIQRQEALVSTRLAEAQQVLSTLREEERAALEAQRAAEAAAQQAAAAALAATAAQAAAAQAAAAPAPAPAAANPAPAAPAAPSVAPAPARPAPAPSAPVANPPAPAPAPAPAPSARGNAAAAVSYALSQVGKGYVLGTSGPSTFDCSGLTMRAWQAGGVNLAHYSGTQYSQTKAVSTSSLQPGDLLFFYAISEHVGIYIGNGQFVHAANPGRGVVLDSLNSYYRSQLVAASRPV